MQFLRGHSVLVRFLRFHFFLLIIYCFWNVKVKLVGINYIRLDSLEYMWALTLLSSSMWLFYIIQITNFRLVREMQCRKTKFSLILKFDKLRTNPLLAIPDKISAICQIRFLQFEERKEKIALGEISAIPWLQGHIDWFYTFICVLAWLINCCILRRQALFASIIDFSSVGQ